MTDQYLWTDNPTESGIARCDTDVLNDCLMHLKYENQPDELIQDVETLNSAKVDIDAGNFSPEGEHCITNMLMLDETKKVRYNVALNSTFVIPKNGVLHMWAINRLASDYMCCNVSLYTPERKLIIDPFLYYWVRLGQSGSSTMGLVKKGQIVQITQYTANAQSSLELQFIPFLGEK